MTSGSAMDVGCDGWKRVPPSRADVRCDSPRSPDPTHCFTPSPRTALRGLGEILVGGHDDGENLLVGGAVIKLIGEVTLSAGVGRAAELVEIHLPGEIGV